WYIRDTTPPPTLSFATTSVAANEGDTVALIVQLAGATTRTATVSVALAGTAMSGTDYTVSATSLRFAPGETTKILMVFIPDPEIDEPEKTIEISLTSAIFAQIDPDAGSAIVTILDDHDPPPTVQFGWGNYTADENQGQAVLDVRL